VKRFLLSGYYGYGNAGDEAVLAGLIAGFRAASAGNLEITALSGNVNETRRAHDIGAVNRYRPAALLPAIARCDVFLSGGGSLLQDVSSAHSIFYYLGIVKMAQMLGKKTMFIAQGIGPLNLPRSRKLVAAVANKLDAVTVRDPASAQLLREIGVTRPSIEVTADPALLLSDPNNYSRDGNVFGVALRPWHGQDTLGTEVADACFHSLGGLEPRTSPVLLPMQNASDRPIARQFDEKWLSLSGSENPASYGITNMGLPPLLSIIAGCDMMVGMRLHALILAAAAGVPSVALSYDPKVAAFMQASGQSDAVYNLNAPDLDRLHALLARVWAERAARAAALQAALPGLRAKAMQNIHVALGLIMKGTTT
jgi:polysaccharide pyruvyl transferase CsaB